MILADTSIWIEHFRSREEEFDVSPLARERRLVHHPYVTGELALGVLGGRLESVIHDLSQLPQLPVLPTPDVLSLIRAHKLFGTGIGWVDAHLIASLRITGDKLWTRDRKLLAVATRLGVAR